MRRLALDVLAACLPSSWTLAVQADVARGDAELDAVLTLDAPDGSSASLVVEVKRQVATRDVRELLTRLRARAERAGLTDASSMLVARYLAPSTRDRIEGEGAAYADATGNLRVVLDRPGLFVRNVGEDRDPWRGPGRPRGSLKGAPAARVVRALVDFAPPYTVPELVERAGASIGATYRVVDFLESEDLLRRTPRGPITSVPWRRLLERWSDDYGFQRSDAVQTFLFPRGIAAVTGRLRDVDGTYALTGSLAAQAYEAYAPPRLAMLYVTDIAAMAEQLDLRGVERGANVALAANSQEVAFERAETIDGVVTAAPSQVAVDLLTGPGRSPGEARALLDWMERDESRWRR